MLYRFETEKFKYFLTGAAVSVVLLLAGPLQAAMPSCSDLFLRQASKTSLNGDINKYIESLAQLYLDIDTKNIPESQIAQATKGLQADMARLANLDANYVRIFKNKISEMHLANKDKNRKQEIEKKATEAARKEAIDSSYINPTVKFVVGKDMGDRREARAISPARKIYASVSELKNNAYQVHVTGLETGAVIQELNLNYKPYVLKFSSDEKTLGILTKEEIFYAYEAHTGKLLQTIQFETNENFNFSLDGHSVTYSVGSYVHKFSVQGKNASNPNEMVLSQAAFSQPGFSPDHSLFIENGHGKTHVIKQSTGRSIFTVGINSSSFFRSTFTRDNRYLVLETFNTTYFVDLKTKKIIREIPYSRASKVFTSDDKNLISCGDGEIRVYEIATGKLINKIDTDMYLTTDFKVSQNGRYVLVWDKNSSDNVAVYDLDKKSEIYRIENEYTDGAMNEYILSPDSQLLILNHQGDPVENGLTIYDLATGTFVGDMANGYVPEFGADSRSIITQVRGEQTIKAFSIYGSQKKSK